MDSDLTNSLKDGEVVWIAPGPVIFVIFLIPRTLRIVIPFKNQRMVIPEFQFCISHILGNQKNI